MEKLGIAIFGTGAVAPVHVQGYSQLENCQVRAICDLYPEKAKKFAQDNGIPDADIYTDYHELLKRDDIFAISICLPPAAHCEVACAALAAGKHVLCEKPMAPSLEECDRMIAAAKASGKTLSIVSNNRFNTSAMRVKAMLDSQAGGKLRFTMANSLWYRGGNYYDIWWRGTWEKECGGCTTSHAVHHMDLLQWMIGMPKRVTAVIGNVAHFNSECEDYAIAILQYPDMVAEVTATICSHDESQELVFQTEKGRISLPWKPYASKALPNGFPEEDTDAEKELQQTFDSLPELKKESHAAQIENFIAAAQGLEAPIVTAQHGRNTIELIMAIYKSSVTQRPVELPIANDDVFYRRETFTKAMPHFFEKTKSVENVENAPPISFGRNLGK